MKTRTVKLGVAYVDSGQLLICDPCYINNEYLVDKKTGHKNYSNHPVYKHKDGSLWQFCYLKKSKIKNVNPFPGTYESIILKYKKNPNQLIKSGEFRKTNMSLFPNMRKGEFSYDSICDITSSKNHGGQLNFAYGLGGVGVAFSTGMGDGTYDVYAELIKLKDWGERVKKVYIEFISPREIENF